MKTRNKLIGIFGVFLAVFFSGNTLAATLTQEFKTNKSFANGTIVSLDAGSNSISPTTRDNVNNIFGVVVKEGDISFSDSQSSDTSVAHSGVVDTLVSNANGDINNGDIITVFGVEGVGEKADSNGRVLGVAQADFNNDSANSQSVSAGNEVIKVGLIPVKISVSNFSDIAGGGDRNRIEKIADEVAGKKAETYAIIASGLILLAGAFAATFLLTSSSFGSMISIGRNPFAQKKIVTSLLGLVALSIAIFGVSLLLSYLILKILG